MARICSLLSDGGCGALPGEALWLWLAAIVVVGAASLVHYVLARGEREELSTTIKLQLEFAEPDDLR